MGCALATMPLYTYKGISMNIGDDVRMAFEDMLEMAGQTIIVHNNWKTPQATSYEVRGRQSAEKNRPQNVLFLFKDRINLKAGSVIQIKMGNDFWKVIDTEDKIVGDTYINFQVRVVKISDEGKTINNSQSGHTIFNAPVYGGIQVGGNNVQNINISIQTELNENIEKLISLITNSSIPTLEKEDAIEALKRIPELAKKEQTEEVINRVKTRLDIVKSALEIGKELAPIAGPLLIVIAKAFGLG